MSTQANFDWQAYLNMYPDVAAWVQHPDVVSTHGTAPQAAWQHYLMQQGLGEGRTYTSYSQPSGMLAPSAPAPSFSTGGGGSFQAPTFDAADIGNWKVATSSSGDNWDGSFWEGFGLNVAPEHALQRYGEMGRHLALPSQGGNSSNYMILPGGSPENGFQLMVKSGEKAGTVVNYKLQNGQYVPQQGTYEQRWDTNAGKQNLDLLKVALAAVGGAAMGGMTGAASTGFTQGAGMTGAGIVAEGGAGALGAAGAATGATAPSYAGWGGSMGVEPISYSGMEGGIGSYGAGFGSPGGVVAGEAGGGLMTSGGYLSNMGGMVPGASSSIWNQAGDALKNALGSDTLAKLAPSVVQSLTGMLAGNAGNQAANNMRDTTINAAQDYKQAYGEYAAGLAGLMPELDKFKYSPATVNNGIATSNVDPVTGKVGFTLNAPYAAERDRYLAGSNAVWGQMGDFDPKTHAAERFAAHQGLLAPSRAQQDQKLYQDLYTKGGYGLVTNSPTALGSSTPVNPYLLSVQAARAQEDNVASYNSLREGETYLDNLMKRQTGMLAGATGLEKSGQDAYTDANTWGNTFNSANKDEARARIELQQKILEANRTGTTGYIDKTLGANQAYIGSTGAANQAQYDQYGQLIQGVASQIPWTSIFKGLFG